MLKYLFTILIVIFFLSSCDVNKQSIPQDHIEEEVDLEVELLDLTPTLQNNSPFYIAKDQASHDNIEIDVIHLSDYIDK